MKSKLQLIADLQEEFKIWEKYLPGLNEDQITVPQVPGKWSVKDVIAHLWVWQQVSIARLNAAQSGNEPQFPSWLEGLKPEDEKNREKFNENIYQENRNKEWSTIYEAWKLGFNKFIELAELIPEEHLLEAGKYTWLADYPLAAVLVGSCNHHKEHLEHLQSK